MAFIQEEENLYDNKWTQAIVERKEVWEKFANELHLEITGKFSNYGVQFDIPIKLPQMYIHIYGHRRLVNTTVSTLLPDVFNEVFEIKMFTEAPLLMAKSSLFKRNLLGNTLRSMLFSNHCFVNEKYQLAANDPTHFTNLNNIGITSLPQINRISTTTQKIEVRTEQLPGSMAELAQVAQIIKNLQELPSKYRPLKSTTETME